MALNRVDVKTPEADCLPLLLQNSWHWRMRRLKGVGHDRDGKTTGPTLCFFTATWRSGWGQGGSASQDRPATTQCYSHCKILASLPHWTSGNSYQTTRVTHPAALCEWVSEWVRCSKAESILLRGGGGWRRATAASSDWSGQKDFVKPVQVN